MMIVDQGPTRSCPVLVASPARHRHLTLSSSSEEDSSRSIFEKCLSNSSLDPCICGKGSHGIGCSFLVFMLFWSILLNKGLGGTAWEDSSSPLRGVTLIDIEIPRKVTVFSCPQIPFPVLVPLLFSPGEQGNQELLESVCLGLFPGQVFRLCNFQNNVCVYDKLNPQLCEEGYFKLQGLGKDPWST